MFRQGIQWLGGMGMVVMALAVMPMLGVGGMRLYVAETPGPLKEEKIVPRIQQTASILLGVYAGLTLACALAFYLAGMDVFDAIAHSLSTLSTGGFSTRNASIGHFQSLSVELVAVVFMILGGVSFGVHYVALSGHNPKIYLENAETRWYLSILGLATLVTTAGLVLAADQGVGWSLRAALFQVASIMTSTGFGTEPFWLWASFLPLFLMLVSMVGGCGGSTAGGVKVFRFLLVAKQVLWNMKRLLHPSGEFTIAMGGRAVDRSVLDFVWGFVSAYILGFLVMWVLMVAGGLDMVSAFGAVAACINNLGPGLGSVGASFAEVNSFVKAVGIAAMLFGRMEVFTLLILLHPSFWRN
jgi:trk system potassium uptake protein TrkH